MEKQNKTKIGVGYVVKAKVGELEKITREGRIRRMRKYVVGCVQSVVGKKKFLVQFEYGQKKETSSSSLVFLILREEVETGEAISHSTKKEQDELLTIVGDPEVACLENVCICLCFIVCVMQSIYPHICWRTRCCKREIRN